MKQQSAEHSQQTTEVTSQAPSAANVSRRRRPVPRARKQYFGPAVLNSLIILAALIMTVIAAYFHSSVVEGRDADAVQTAQADTGSQPDPAEDVSLRGESDGQQTAAVAERDYMPADIYFEEYDRRDFERIRQEYKRKILRERGEQASRQASGGEGRIRKIAGVFDEAEN